VFGSGVFMRKVLILVCALSASGCTQRNYWDRAGIDTLPGGIGITADHQLEEGPSAVSSISSLPRSNSKGALPPFGTQGYAAAYEHPDGYRLGAGDKVNIRVLGEPDLTGAYVIDPTGNISLPYVPSLQVAGRTAAEIEKLITSRLKQGYIRDPQVAVQVTDLRPFFITGEVSSSGSFAYQPGMTAQNAIILAGGYSPRANRNYVMLTRRTARGMQTYRVPVSTQIYPGDIVYVRERWF
jgi:polysaccharide biosynthesis/export protein